MVSGSNSFREEEKTRPAPTSDSSLPIRSDSGPKIATLSTLDDRRLVLSVSTWLTSSGSALRRSFFSKPLEAGVQS